MEKPIDYNCKVIPCSRSAQQLIYHVKIGSSVDITDPEVLISRFWMLLQVQSQKEGMHWL